jgi:hypothetical protein
MYTRAKPSKTPAIDEWPPACLAHANFVDVAALQSCGI